jgi:hypothetical protein
MWTLSWRSWQKTQSFAVRADDYDRHALPEQLGQLPIGAGAR